MKRFAACFGLADGLSLFDFVHVVSWRDVRVHFSCWWKFRANFRRQIRCINFSSRSESIWMTSSNAMCFTTISPEFAYTDTKLHRTTARDKTCKYASSERFANNRYTLVFPTPASLSSSPANAQNFSFGLKLLDLEVLNSHMHKRKNREAKMEPVTYLPSSSK